jgi:hypothetical protein
MSMGSDNDLTMKLKLDNIVAKGAVDDLKSHIKQATAESSEDMKKLEGTSVSSMTAFTGAMVGFQLLNQAVAQGFVQEFQKASDYIREIAKEYTTLRDTMREMAAYMNKTPDKAFTLEQAQNARIAGVTPQEWVKFQTAAQGQAGQFLGGDGAKMDPAQSMELQRDLAAYGKGKGFAPDDVASILAPILASSKKGATVADTEGSMARVLSTIQDAAGAAGTLLPQMRPLVAESVGEGEDFANPEQAAKFLNVMANFKPERAYQYSRSMLSQMNQLEREGKGEELGWTKGMDVFQKVEATKKAMEASGENQDDFLSQYFTDKFSLSGIKTQMKYGVGGGQYGKIDSDMAKLDPNYMKKTIADFRKTEAGQSDAAEAAKAEARAIGGSEYAALMNEYVKAEGELDREGRFKRMQVGDVAASAANVAMFGALGSAKEQAIRQRAYNNVMTRDPNADAGWVGMTNPLSRPLADDQMIAELKRLREMEEAKANARQSPPLDANRKPVAGRMEAGGGNW